MLQHLAAVDVLSRDASGRYALTNLGAWLCNDHPSGIRASLDIDGAVGRAELSSVHLLHSVRTGEASFPLLYGQEFWDDLASEPDRTASFDRLMGTDVAAWADHIVPSYDWGSLGNVIDVGGGNGTLLAALLEAHPGLRGAVFDQPATVEAARTTLVAAGFGDRIEVVSGSFFDPLPTGAGGYILSAILHDWNDELASAILRRCAQAAGSTGKVFVIEKTGLGGESPSSAMDLRLLGYFGGRERGVTEICALAADSGLELTTVHPAGDLSIVEFTAA